MKSVSLKKKNKIIKRTRTRPRDMKKVFHSVTVCMAVVAFSLFMKVGYAFLTSADFFSVQQINTAGCTVRDKNEIINKAGLRKGENIISMNLAEKSRKLEQDPWIYKAVIKRKLPHTIEIQVEERAPLAVIKLDKCYLIDDYSHLFKTAEQNEMKYPLLTGLTKNDFKKNSDASSKVISAALELVKQLQAKNMANGIDTTIEMDLIFGLTMTNTKNNIKIFMGFGRYGKKITLLTKIIDDLEKRQIPARAINIDSLEKAYITYKG